jgi:hypothetical protein
MIIKDSTDADRIKLNNQGMAFYDSLGNVSVLLNSTTEDKTITVGSDKDFSDIQAALDSIPYFVNHTIKVNIDSGTFAESVIVPPHAGGGTIQIYGQSSPATNIVKLYVNSCTCRIEVKYLTATITTLTDTAFKFYRCKDAYVWNLTSTSAYSTHGIDFVETSGFVYYCTMSNKAIAYYAGSNSNMILRWPQGSGNVNGIYAVDSKITLSDSFLLTATTLRDSTEKGIIIADAADGGTEINGISLG